MKRLLVCAAIAFIATAFATTATAKTLDIYFIDVEGGQSTLIVTPAGQSFLIDTGFPGDGGPQAKAGDPNESRDARRIAAAASDAGINHIDYLLITHFHGDHVGGAPELAQLIPVYTFVDHGSVSPQAEANVPGSEDVFAAYVRARSKGRHLRPKPGDKIPLKGVDVVVVSSAGSVLPKPLSGAGRPNAACPSSGLDAQDPNENPRSTGIRLKFGKFKFLDVGDLTGPPLFALACPMNLIGPVDVYLVAHHGGPDTAEPATFAAFKPRAAVMNNGATKGGALATYKMLHTIAGLEDVWQLHRSIAAGTENFADEHIANLDESTGHWLKLSANKDGSFQIVNGRTGVSKIYRAP